MRVLLVEDRAQRPEVVLLAPLGGERSKLGLEHEEGLVQCGEGDRAPPQCMGHGSEHGGVGLRADNEDPRADALDETGLLQQAQRLADGGAADAHLAGQCDLGRKSLALLEVAGEDRVADRRRDPLVLARFSRRVRSCRHRREYRRVGHHCTTVAPRPPVR
jgi:hypothetical protein